MKNHSLIKKIKKAYYSKRSPNKKEVDFMIFTRQSKKWIFFKNNYF